MIPTHSNIGLQKSPLSTSSGSYPSGDTRVQENHQQQPEPSIEGHEFLVWVQSITSMQIVQLGGIDHKKTHKVLTFFSSDVLTQG